MAPAISLNDQHDWDDSALIDSWESALDEYKKYHSIQAQGKRLEDVLTAEELSSLKADYGDLVEDVETTTKAADGGIYAGQIDTETPEASGNANSQVPQDVTQVEEVTAPTDQESSTKTVETNAHTHDEAHAASMPQAILGTVQDENLKNLMMAWYYAGYYTGVQQSRPLPGDGK
ncbi:hypothetical protein B0J11DRAFT_528241 [Dendryphion nanum]|uniref:Survival motor neuron Tudor domain-containing protein n=1 Tax=Dendryphion nanum TaxID=256645 RepID=A0A9P9DU76_9PLEO|nr:hypothetical protein B0J11DRAFT_528241 [Dendryphion nanum]